MAAGAVAAASNTAGGGVFRGKAEGLEACVLVELTRALIDVMCVY